MKRSGPLRRGKPLQRKTPLKRGAPLKRSAPLKRGGPLKRTGSLKRKPKPKLTALERALMREFLGNVRRERCAACGRAAPEVQIAAHHVLRRQVIEGKLAGLHPWEVFAAAWDPRWRMPLCETCHGDHHSGMKRLPLSLVRRTALLALAVADIYGLTDYLNREYTED